jgi:chromosome partitioning protein
MPIICVANQKGGVAKTTTTVSLAHGLTLRGKRVLLIDLDPQGQAATLLGIDHSEACYDFLVSKRTQYHQVMTEARSNFFIIPGNKETNTAGVVVRDKPIDLLAEKIAPALEDGFDYILMDTAPSVNDIQVRAIYACNYLLAPTAVDFLSSEGVYQLIETAEEVKNTYKWRGELLGILPTFFDATKESRANIDELKTNFSKSILEPIHRAVSLRESAAIGKTIFEVDPKGRAAKEYFGLVDYVLKVAR